jgi:hypothetical protein
MGLRKEGTEKNISEKGGKMNMEFKKEIGGGPQMKMYGKEPGLLTGGKHAGCKCSLCGSDMVEVDRTQEEPALYIWYQCCQEDCGNQLLRRINQRHDLMAMRPVSF